MRFTFGSTRVLDGVSFRRVLLGASAIVSLTSVGQTVHAADTTPAAARPWRK